MKGITPIISTIVLLLITVALAGTAWAFISGYMGTYTEKSFTIPQGGAYCDSAGRFHATVVNSGTTTILGTDWVYADASNNTYAVKLVASDVSPKISRDFTNMTNGGVNGINHGLGQPGKAYTITIGTLSGVQRVPVVCP
jgi:flagellin-like protein